MAYARWSSEAELKDTLTKVEGTVKKSGIPMYEENGDIYLNDKEYHNLVIGITGSGKTQLTMLPQLKYAIEAGESFIVNDVKGAIKETLKDSLKENSYEVITINLANPSEGNNYNPLLLPYELYKKNKDAGVELIDKISHYIFVSEETNVDPFWENSASSLFAGIALYMFETKKKEEITLKTLYELSLNLDEINTYLEKVSKSSALYINLISVLGSPKETKASIISVFMQNLKLYISRESLLNMMENTNFELSNLKEGKKAIFVVSDSKKTSNRLVPIILEELYEELIAEESKKNFNIIIDEFENLFPIKDFNAKLTEARSHGIRFTIVIKSILELRNKYGKENAELLRMAMGNIIYLLANDEETLESISKLCGEEMTEKGLVPLITKEDLKLMKKQEAVVLMPRMYPIKTRLKAYYEL